MSLSVCLHANTLRYPQGGGHQWVFLNWALGLLSLGCRVIWLEYLHGSTLEQTLDQLAALRTRLGHYGLGEAICLYATSGEPLPKEVADQVLPFKAATEADLLLNFQYRMPAAQVGRFRRAVLIDIDPGLLRAVWPNSISTRERWSEHSSNGLCRDPFYLIR